jgi:uncharacterized protein involved in exopolysaccharide biosynthesis
MADDDQNEEQEGSSQNSAAQLELVRSYLAFAGRAIRPRWWWVASVLTIGLALTIVVFKVAPRTYSCTTVLMALSNPVLDQNGGGNPLANAPSLIMRQENLQQLVRDTSLVEKFKQRRPPLLKAKDDLIQKAFGQWNHEVQEAILVGTLQSKLSVGSDQAGNLTITVDWTDGKTAAEVAEAAREGFLRGRHSAEISAFEAKMSILDEHASRLRSEVETLAQQINSAHEEKAAHVTKPAGDAGAASATPGTSLPALRAAARRATNSDLSASLSAELPERKAKLAELKQQLIARESDRERHLREEQAKLAEMQLHLTPSHPQVVTQQERISLALQVPSDLALLRTEVADLESTIKQREALATHGTSAITGGPSSTGPSPAALPTEIIQALESDTIDPALSAQISGAVVRYGSLRDEIRSGRMQLDTAQAAFDHRYQIVTPAEAPNTPTKPKPGLIIGAGFALSLLLSLLFPLLAELRRGVIIERWQVHQLQLPVLAELKLPPHSPD